MRIRIHTALVALLMSIVGATGVLAFNEPDRFRGMSWGASEEQANKLRELSCFDHSTTEPWWGDRWCLEAFELGPVRISATYNFRRNRFVRADLRFLYDRFEEVLRVFVDRYGSPTRERREMFTNRMGARFENRIVTWEGPRVVITIQQYGADLSEGSATLQTQQEMKESERLYQDKFKGAGKGL